jgi:spermidine/putrescine transport system ATP-binding protein
MTEAGIAISIIGVRKSFGDVRAVDGISLDIAEGEFITLLGPSGCGKTTTMRMVAGFEEPDNGTILLRGKDVAGVPPNKREVNMCFQHYALFPHMNVEKNIAYGLKLKKVPAGDRRRIVGEMLEIVGLAGMQARKPNQLSGGQQQRVALARALVNQPAALLLDEPLGALDVKLRKQMQLELKRIQHELNTTFVYVTHDQDEALSMSDRIAVMKQGVIEQLGAPREVYEQPATPFVADFVGVLNAMDVRIDEATGDDLVMRVNDRDRIVVSVGPTGADARIGSSLLVAVRPERVQLAVGEVSTNGESRLSGTVRQIVYLGTLTQFYVDTAIGKRLIVHHLSDDRSSSVMEGDEVVLTWGRDDAAILSDS